MSPVPPPSSPKKALTFEDVALCDTENEWATENKWASATPHKSLCHGVMLENAMHVAFLVCSSTIKRYNSVVERVVQAMPPNAVPPDAIPPNVMPPNAMPPNAPPLTAPPSPPSPKHQEDQEEA